MHRNQIIAVVIAVLSVTAASTAQLTDLFGPTVAKTIISAAGFGNSVLAAVLAVFTGQNGIIKDAQAMPGVEKIVVNDQANKTLANIALDPAALKVEAESPRVESKLEQISKG